MNSKYYFHKYYENLANPSKVIPVFYLTQLSPWVYYRGQIRQNLGLAEEAVCMLGTHVAIKQNGLTLKLKTWPKQRLGYLPLDMELPDINLSNSFM